MQPLSSPSPPMDLATVRAAVGAVADDFRAEALTRGARTHLKQADFDRLRAAGFQMLAVPARHGGLWQDVRSSTRACADIVSLLATGDPAVALVATMHPVVLAYWFLVERPAESAATAWANQCEEVFTSVRDGAWWATANSEPGSGGDMATTRATAQATVEGGYRISGNKHFASGAGIADFMITAARPQAEDVVATFFVDMRDRVWDGSSGLTMTRAWDGRGMRATQSHAFRFDDYPAQRMVDAAGGLAATARAVSARQVQFSACLFTAVTVGVVREAMRWARARIAGIDLRPYAQTEWVRVENAAWLLEQAHAGMLAAVERGDVDAPVACLRGKVVIAELAEELLLRAQRALGGSSYSLSSPLGQWAEDVRALGFLRPPWALAFDQLIAASARPD